MSLRAKVRAEVGTLVLDVEIDTAPGTLVIVGPNGAGKTSFLSVLLGVWPARGHVAIGERVLFDGAGIDVPVEHRRLGYVPQDYALFPHLTVRQNVEFAEGARADALSSDLGLTALADRHPLTLSGGEKQRVALARALSVSPQALLLDEPLAALDIPARREVREFLVAYLRKLALPTIVVTHDATDARVLGHRIAVLEAGKITQSGTWDELVKAPATRFVKELVAFQSPRESTPEPV